MSKITKVGNITIDEENKEFKIDSFVSKDRSIMSKAALTLATGGLFMMIPKGGKSSTGWKSFDDLISYELIQNDDVVVTGGVGKAIVGGSVMSIIGGGLWGIAGALVGGMTSKRTSSKKIHSLDIRVTVNDFKNPCFFIHLLKKPVKSDSKEYLKIVEEAQRIMSTLDLITHHKG